MKTTYVLTTHSYTGTFEVNDQEYLLDGSIMQFSATPLVLDPVDPTLVLDYTAVRQGEPTLPKSFINFDSATLEFTVQSLD